MADSDFDDDDDKKKPKLPAPRLDNGQHTDNEKSFMYRMGSSFTDAASSAERLLSRGGAYGAELLYRGGSYAADVGMDRVKRLGDIPGLAYDGIVNSGPADFARGLVQYNPDAVGPKPFIRGKNRSVLPETTGVLADAPVPPTASFSQETAGDVPRLADVAAPNSQPLPAPSRSFGAANAAGVQGQGLRFPYIQDKNTILPPTNQPLTQQMNQDTGNDGFQAHQMPEGRTLLTLKPSIKGVPSSQPAAVPAPPPAPAQAASPATKRLGGESINTDGMVEVIRGTQRSFALPDGSEIPAGLLDHPVIAKLVGQMQSEMRNATPEQAAKTQQFYGDMINKMLDNDSQLDLNASNERRTKTTASGYMKAAGIRAKSGGSGVGKGPYTSIKKTTEDPVRGKREEFGSFNNVSGVHEWENNPEAMNSFAEWVNWYFNEYGEPPSDELRDQMMIRDGLMK